MPGRPLRHTAVASVLTLGLVAAGFSAVLNGQSTAAAPASAQTAQQEQTLRELAEQQGTFIGAAVADHHLDEDAYAQTAAEEFNSVTHENSLKWESVQPQQGEYSWAGADRVVDFAEEHGQDVHGHTLVWHSQLPSWVSDSGFTEEELLAVMDDHINTTMGRFAGQIDTWDVVNEPIDDDAQYRDSVFHETLGEDFIAQSLHMARDADPSADLYINDYSIDGINAKSDAYYDLAVDLLEQGAPLDGIGLQAHLIVGQVPDTMSDNIQRFVDLGLDVRITELDVRMDTPATEADLLQQAEDYGEVVDMCLGIDGCTGVTVWGVTDAYSWVPDHFEGEGAALPIDEDYAPKDAYWAIHEVLGGSGSGPTDPPTDEPTDPPTDDPTDPTGDCDADYALVSQWDGGFQGEVTVTAGTDLSGWTVTWTTEGTESIDQAWNATVSQSGDQVTAVNDEHNGQLSPGESTSFGFLGSGTPSNSPEPVCAT